MIYDIIIFFIYMIIFFGGVGAFFLLLTNSLDGNDAILIDPKPPVPEDKLE